MATVRAFSRIHFSLLDLGHATRNRYGGGGLLLEAPYTRVTAIGAQFNSAESVGRTDDLSDVCAALDRFTSTTGVRSAVKIESHKDTHVGLGSKTAAILGALAAANIEHETHLTESALQRLSGRGGTSGIGINCFFVGGFVIDSGRKDDLDEAFEPSSATSPQDTPRIVLRMELPRDWDVVLITLPSLAFYGEAEREFFRDNTPIPREECHRAISIMYHDIAPAIADCDIEGLAWGIKSMCETGFKAREVAAQPECVRRAMEDLRRIDRCAVGLSSMGPTIFAIHESRQDGLFDRLSGLIKGATISRTTARNAGFERE